MLIGLFILFLLSGLLDDLTNGLDQRHRLGLWMTFIASTVFFNLPHYLPQFLTAKKLARLNSIRSTNFTASPPDDQAATYPSGVVTL